jgi:putative phosphoribosyl transferase
MATLIEDTKLRNKTYVFDNREEAGKLLSKELAHYKGTHTIILAIPSGGVPVAIEIQRALSVDLDLMIVRKAQLPWTTEAGFGAVNLDGDVVLNDKLIRSVALTEETIEEQVDKTREIIEKRNLHFRKGKREPAVKDRTVIIVDDGLASGYTMRAALQFVRKRNPCEIVIAAPTGSYRTITALMKEVDSIYCLNVREGFPFAVADAYREWYDLTDDDVIDLMKRLQS